jgi:amino acid transporter
MDDHDEAELRLLARLHYVLAIITALCSLIAVPFLGAGAGAVHQPAGEVDEAYLAALFSLAIGISLGALCLVHAGVLVYFGRLIQSHRRRWLILVFSALHLINVPLGTALSIYAFMVLGRESVKSRFK